MCRVIRLLRMLRLGCDGELVRHNGLSVIAFAALVVSCTGNGGSPSGPLDATSSMSSGTGSTASSSSSTIAEVEVIDVGRSPWGVAIGFKSVWVPTADSLVRVDARTGDVIATVEFPSSITKGATVRGDPLIFNWAAAGKEGIWITVARARLSVLHVDPASNDVVSVIDVGPAPDAPTPLAIGAGRVWVANPSTTILTEIDPRTDEIERTLPLRGFAPVRVSGIAVAAGSVWLMDHNSGTVLRVDPETGKPTDRIELDTSGRLFASAGAIWAASAGEDLVQAINADTGTADPAFETCAGVNNVVSTRAQLWVSTGTAIICVIDLETDEQHVVDLPAGGGIVAAVGSSAWVSLPTAGQIAHVSLPRAA